MRDFADENVNRVLYLAKTLNGILKALEDKLPPCMNLKREFWERINKAANLTL